MKKLLLMAFVLGGLFMSSCLRDRFDGDTAVPGAKADFRLKISLDKNLDTDLVITRATVDPTPAEEQVQNIVLLFFEQTANASGQYLGAVKLDSGPYRMNTDIPVSFGGTGIDGMAPHNILILANAFESYLGVPVDDWIASLSGKTEQRVFDESRAMVKGALNNSQTDNSQAIPADRIPMTARATRSGGQPLVSAAMTRVVSRFDVLNDVNTRFNLVSVSIWNAYPETSIFGGGVIDYTSDRIERFYGIDNTDNGYANIIGGLYSFENRVAQPVQNDRRTTNLIVGLTPIADNNDFGETWTAGDVKYYRVNINPDGNAQALKRNNAYRLTVRGVGGLGKGTEQEAYTESSNNLNYVINYWNLDDDGLIVYDGNNLLAIPTKTVRLNPDGETRELSIFTFGSGVLQIRSQSFGGSDKIRATLSGNMLSIAAQPLAGEDERTGSIELAFAGLTATINVIQSGSSGLFLEVVTPTGSGIPVFQSSAWYPSGIITVKASGPWTATLHMDGFTFSVGADKETLTSAEAPNNQFQIYTSSMHDGTTPREAFVMIRLDDDPDNFNSVLLLRQKAAGAINVTPTQRIVAFKPNRDLDTSQTSYAQTNTFNVFPSFNAPEPIPTWKAEIVRATGTANDDSSLFEIFDLESSTSDVNGNKVSVRPVAMNALGRELRATLKISLISEPSVYTEIAIIQQKFDINFTAVPKVSEKGGMSNVVKLTSSVTELMWKVQSIDTYTTALPAVLNYHKATVQDQDGVDINPGADTAKDMSQGFRVTFPKVYYPNRDKAIYATVTLTLGYLNGLGNFEPTGTYTVTVEQNRLTARAIVPGSMRAGYSSIGTTGSYFGYYRNMIVNGNVFGPGKTVPVGPIAYPSPNIEDNAIPAGINYLHANSYGTDFPAATIKRISDWWKSNTDGVLLMANDVTSTNNAWFTDSNSPLYQYGITRNGNLDGALGTSNRDGRTMNTANTNSTRIGQFLTTKGAYAFTPAIGMDFYGDGVSAAANLTNLVNGENVVVIVGMNNNKVGLFIDPSTRFVYFGEAQFFAIDTINRYENTTGTPSSNYDKFLANVVSYVFYTAAYGSHFSDLLMETQTLPAPWDPSWNE